MVNDVCTCAADGSACIVTNGICTLGGSTACSGTPIDNPASTTSAAVSFSTGASAVFAAALVLMA